MREREDNMTASVIHLAIGLVLLVAVNIVLGSMNALFDGTFDKVKLRNGIIKGIIVAACFIAFYMAGWLNPDIIAIDIAAGRKSRYQGPQADWHDRQVQLYSYNGT